MMECLNSIRWLELHSCMPPTPPLMFSNRMGTTIAVLRESGTTRTVPMGLGLYRPQFPPRFRESPPSAHSIRSNLCTFMTTQRMWSMLATHPDISAHTSRIRELFSGQGTITHPGPARNISRIRRLMGLRLCTIPFQGAGCFLPLGLGKGPGQTLSYPHSKVEKNHGSEREAGGGLEIIPGSVHTSGPFLSPKMKYPCRPPSSTTCIFTRSNGLRRHPGAAAFSACRGVATRFGITISCRQLQRRRAPQHHQEMGLRLMHYTFIFGLIAFFL